MKRRPSTAEMNAVNQPFAKKKKNTTKKKNTKKMWLFKATARQGGIEVEAPDLDCRNELVRPSLRKKKNETNKKNVAFPSHRSAGRH